MRDAFAFPVRAGKLQLMWQSGPVNFLQALSQVYSVLWLFDYGKTVFEIDFK